MFEKRAPLLFNRAFDRGNDPDNGGFDEPLESNAKFNLFERVSTHLPGTQDWLFKSLSPYLRAQMPDVGYAQRLITRCLQRLGLTRISSESASFLVKNLRKRLFKSGRHTLDVITESPDPIHLCLLVALFHERQWHEYRSGTTKLLAKAFCTAWTRFCCRDEFKFSLDADQLRNDAASFFRKIYWRIWNEGHRSPRPPDQLIDLHSCSFPIFLESGDRTDEMIEAVAWGWAVPAWAFWSDSHKNEFFNHWPTKDQSLKASTHLLDNVVVELSRWHTYDVQFSTELENERVLDSRSQLASRAAFDVDAWIFGKQTA